MNRHTLQIARISAGTVYKLIFIGTVFSLLPLTTLFGILAFFGLNTVRWNGVPVHGVWGLFSGVAIGWIFCLVTTGLLGTACAFGLWLHAKFARLHVTYVLPGPGTEGATAGDALA